MNLYLLAQNENTGYDTYDSMVIAAENETDALWLSYKQAYMIEPSIKPKWREYTLQNDFSYTSWVINPDISIIATNTTESESVVCASFNAG